MQTIIGLIFLNIFSTNLDKNTAFWGATGHRVIGHVATQHISNRTYRKISKLLDGASLAYVSTYADDIKSDPQYRSYNPWHYVNMESDESYDQNKTNTKGDVIQAIQKCISVLKDPEESREEKQFHLKLLVHFVGDIHQPMHVGRSGDRGGNDIKVNWFNTPTNLHRLWDTNLIESHGMSYSEMGQNLPVLSPKQIQFIKQQPLMEWVEESQALAATLYEDTPDGSRLGYAYRYKYMDTVRLQLLKGGLRLAHLLDSIFK